jgi:hypothetical protein
MPLLSTRTAPATVVQLLTRLPPGPPESISSSAAGSLPETGRLASRRLGPLDRQFDRQAESSRGAGTSRWEVHHGNTTLRFRCRQGGFRRALGGPATTGRLKADATSKRAQPGAGRSPTFGRSAGGRRGGFRSAPGASCWVNTCCGGSTSRARNCALCSRPTMCSTER